ncbi:Zinc finger CCCH domain-containing protein 15 [Sesamum alatum]|uniref:Zinc finger CCCH domain-containing protein 15 n=1 Tax=Sesamum alatum TaxID=300844 RepID=A0AAE1YIS4_9LAMI|nr:Zinc finger CCCH domain-containing protein 15 [Sesamum alatum]
MQREISISGHEKPTVSAASPPFTGGYDFAASLYPSIFPPMHSPLLDHLKDRSSVSPPRESDDVSASCLPQFPQQHLHQDLMDRHQTVLSHLRDVVKQAQALRQENVNLKMANFDLNNRLNMLLNAAPCRGVDLVPGLNSVVDGLRSMGFGTEEEGTSENEAVVKSPTSVMDPGRGDRGELDRVHLPKSISVRSSGYLKAVRTGWSSGKGGDCGKASNQNRIDNGTQRVYVKGGKKEQPLELEVYNQGMFKTELCNKWQQTGTCPYGDNCQFAHGIEELRPVLRHPRYKTEICRMVLNGVPCPYGHRCHFRHTLTDQEQLTRAMNSNALQPLDYR